MIQIYISTNTNYNKNGDMSLIPTRTELKASGINKPVELELEHTLDNLCRYKYLEKGNVIKCYTPFDKKNGQLFRIYDLDKDSADGIITVYAIQLFYDNLTTYVKDFENKDILICDTGNVPGEKALNKILSNTPYTGFSDITTSTRSRFERKNIVAAITGSDENSFVNKWGGELYIDNFNIYMNRKIGRVSGIAISYGRNQKSIKESSSLNNTVTRIIPIGFNGLSLEGKTPWVDSPNISKYPTIMEREIKFDHVKLKSPDREDGFETIEEARLELIRLSTELFKEGIDCPELTIKTEIEDLSKTVEYAEYSCLEEINLGDYIKATHYKFNIDTIIRCEGYVWNVLTEEYISITLGNSIHNFFDKQTEGLNKIKDILNNDGTVNAVEVMGILNAVNVQMKAMRDIAQNVPVRAMICEDLIKDSPTYGAMCWGTSGFMIASERTLDNKDWNWRTFGTGKGFFADLIVAGTMLADRIRGGILESMDGSLRLDLSDTTKGIQFMKNGLRAININGNQLDFFDWDGLGEAIAKIYSARFGNDEFKTGLAIANRKGSSLSLAYEIEDGTYQSYITFDKDNILHEDAIQVNESILFNAISKFTNYIRTIGIQDSSDENNNFFKAINAWVANKDLKSNGSISAFKDIIAGGKFKGNLESEGYAKCYGLQGTDGIDNKFFGQNNKWIANRDFLVNGDFAVVGTKNCIQKTENYGNRLFYSVEDGQSFVTETSESDLTVLKTKEGKFERVVLITNIYKESANLEVFYIVQINKVGWGDYNVKEKNKDYFILESNREDFTFNYCIKAKRRGFENVSLEEYINVESEVVKDVQNVN